jgi:hypothetical protein
MISQEIKMLMANLAHEYMINIGNVGLMTGRDFYMILK